MMKTALSSLKGIMRLLNAGLRINLEGVYFAVAAILLLPCICRAQDYQQPPPLLSRLGIWCGWGTCDIATPAYINVYWDSSVAQWNSDVTSFAVPGKPSGSLKDRTVDRIDTLMQSLVHSQYFNWLKEYDVSSVVVLPSIAASSCGPPPNTVDDAVAQLGAFATCVLASNSQINPSVAVLNVLLPPQTGPGTFCSASAAEHDYFGSPVEMTLIPTNPACHPLACDGNDVSPLFCGMTHEMVEAATDPNYKSPTGWKQPGTNGEIGDLCETEPHTQAQNPSNPATQVSQQPFLYGSVSTYYSFVGNLGWNAFNINVSGNCVPLPPSSVLTFTTNATCPPSAGSSSGVPDCPASPFGPQIKSTTACGSGSSMAMAAEVASIGPSPWDLSPLNAAGTVYFNVGVDATKRNGGTWSAGAIHNFPPDQVTFGTLIWPNPDASGNTVIQALGFRPFAYPGSTQGYGAPGPDTSSAIVRPSDSITLNIFDTNFGQQLATTLTAESPSQILGLGVVSPPYTDLPSAITPANSDQWFFVADSGKIPGYLNGASNCGQGILPPGPYGIEGISVNVSSNNGPLGTDNDTIYPASSTTNNNGFFSVGYTPIIAGLKNITAREPNSKVTATTSVSVHPIVNAISPNVGPEKFPVVLNGAGFSKQHVTAASFSEGTSAAQATNVSVVSSGTVDLTTPSAPAPLVGGLLWVDVVANVDGIPSLPVQYEYIDAGQPALQVIPGGCSPSKLEVDVYDTNGNEVNETVTLQATFAAFKTGKTATVQTPAAIDFSGGGKVTATPGTPPNQSLATTGTFSSGTLFCFPGYDYQNISGFLPQFGPNEDRGFVSQFINNTGFWRPGGDPFGTAGDFVEITSSHGETPVTNFSVKSLSIFKLRSLLRSGPSILVRSESGSGKVRFTGRSILIAKSEAAKTVDPLSAKGAISFALPTYSANPADYRILHLTSSTAGSWKEVPTVKSSHMVHAIRANISEAGVYALVTLTPPR